MLQVIKMMDRIAAHRLAIRGGCCLDVEADAPSIENWRFLPRTRICLMGGEEKEERGKR